MSDNIQQDPMLTLIVTLLLTVLIVNGIGSFITSVFTAGVNRHFEFDKRLCALKTRIKGFLRPTTVSADSRIIENLADELDELAQLARPVIRRKRRERDREVTSFDLLEAVDILREAASVPSGVEVRLEPLPLVEKLRIRLSPDEKQRWSQSDS